MGKTNGFGPKRPSEHDVEIVARLSMKYRVPTVDLNEYEIDAAITALVPRKLCEVHGVIPVSRAGSSLIVAMANPTDVAAIDALKEHTGYNIEPVIATKAAIREAIEKCYGGRR